MSFESKVFLLSLAGSTAVSVKAEKPSLLLFTSLALFFYALKNVYKRNSVASSLSYHDTNINLTRKRSHSTDRFGSSPSPSSVKSAINTTTQLSPLSPPTGLSISSETVKPTSLISSSSPLPKIPELEDDYAEQVPEEQLDYPFDTKDR